jgi:hypothetical protein
VIEAEEKVKQIQANIEATQSRQKSYTDKRCSPLEFKVGDHVYLRASPMKGVRRFSIKGKLAPRYIGSYPIIDKYGANVLSSGITNEAIGSSQCVSCLPTQKMSKASG